MAMSTKVYNVSGSGVRNAYHLVVGMAVVSIAGGKEVKRAAISQDTEKCKSYRKRRKVETAFTESLCRSLPTHQMWQYLCTYRPYPIQFWFLVSGVQPVSPLATNKKNDTLVPYLWIL